MLLIDQIRKAQIEARKAKDAVAATLLTTLIGEATTVAKNAQRANPTDEEVQAVVKKFLKGNNETQAALNKVFITAESLDKLDVARTEQAILESYLPKQLSEFELKSIIESAVAAGTPKDMGTLMGFLKKGYAGQYDGKVASGVIKAAIS